LFTEPKSIKIERLREVLGEEAAKAILAELMRKQVSNVGTWYPEDPAKALALLDQSGLETDGRHRGGESTARRHAFGRIAYKFISEDARIQQRFRDFIAALDNKENGEGYPCPTCGAVYKSMSSLNTHKMWHSRDRSPKACPVCGKETKNLQSHISSSADAPHREFRESSHVAV